MNELQLFEYYLSIPLAERSKPSWIYPIYVRIVGRSCIGPHPHKHFSLEEFLDKLQSDKEFYKILNTH